MTPFHFRLSCGCGGQWQWALGQEEKESEMRKQSKKQWSCIKHMLMFAINNQHCCEQVVDGHDNENLHLRDFAQVNARQWVIRRVLLSCYFVGV